MFSLISKLLVNSINHIFACEMSFFVLFLADSIVRAITSTASRSEWKTGQLMGSFLYSNGEHVIVSHPAY